MKLHIMTWNTGITEQINYPERCKQVFEYIQEFLNQENSVVFLQQIVYKDPDNNWRKHNMFEFFGDYFDSQTHDIEYYRKSSFMMTVAIAKKGTLTQLGDEYYPSGTPRNRAIAVRFNNISFLAIHAQNGQENKEYLKALPEKPDIILGDFNAGNYIESENREVFNQILKNHICICNMPTKIIDKGSIKRIGTRTCIDHIFVRYDMITKCSDLIVHEDINLSDHFPISFDYNIDDVAKA